MFFKVFFFSVPIEQLWSQELIDLLPLKILEVEWDWWQSLASVNMCPRWPDGIWTALQVIRMHCVITMSTIEGVKTQLVVYKGQAFNILGHPQFSLQGSWTCNLSTSAEFMSHCPVENINQSLPEAHHSIAANSVNILSVSKHWLSFKTIFFQCVFTANTLLNFKDSVLYSD